MMFISGVALFVPFLGLLLLALSLPLSRAGLLAVGGVR